jgi:hypothetical protein
MLKLDREEFTCGRSIYLDFLDASPEPTAKVFVKILLKGRVLSTVYAQVDTGAPWSVLDPRVAALLGLLPITGHRTRLDTRLGRIEGALVRIPIQFLADHGEHFETEAS